MNEHVNPLMREILNSFALRSPVKRAGQITHARPVVVVSDDAPANDATQPVKSFREIEASATDDARKAAAELEAFYRRVDAAMLADKARDGYEARREANARDAELRQRVATGLPFCMGGVR